MRRMFTTQIALLIIFSSMFTGLVFFTDVYDEVYTRIVSVTCLSCIKLDPKTSSEFLFETATGENHPEFVLENLSRGPVFIAYRKDVCTYCDEMEPLIMSILNITFEKEDVFYKIINFKGNNIIFIHINRDHASKVLTDSLHIYDKDKVNGVPMFTFVTINYDHDGVVKPYYTTLYAKLGLKNDGETKNYLTKILEESISLYNDNKAGYKP